MIGRPVVVVVGAGIAGLTAARSLVESGAGVIVVDKSRGVGGRMATRRIGREGSPTYWVPGDESSPATREARAPSGSGDSSEPIRPTPGTAVAAISVRRLEVLTGSLIGLTS